MLPGDALDQFASTFKEWHYLTGGISIGVLGCSLLVAVVVVLTFGGER